MNRPLHPEYVEAIADMQVSAYNMRERMMSTVRLVGATAAFGVLAVAGGDQISQISNQSNADIARLVGNIIGALGISVAAASVPEVVKDYHAFHEMKRIMLPYKADT